MANEPKSENDGDAAETPEQSGDEGLNDRKDAAQRDPEQTSGAADEDAADLAADSGDATEEPGAAVSDLPDEQAPPHSDAASGHTNTDDTSAPTLPVPAPPPARRGMSVVLGGVIAALIGAGALYLAQAQDWVDIGGPDAELLARIDALEGALTDADTALAAAETEIAALKAAEPDLSGVTTAIEEAAGVAATAAGENATAIAALTQRLNTTDERLQTVAVQQIPEAELPQAISDAYDAKLEGLLATIDERFKSLQSGLDTKLTEIETSQAAAAEAEAAAEAAARMAEARAALATIDTALEDGTAFAGPLATLAELGGVDVPPALTDIAEDGAPSVGDLSAAFPAAARAALTVSSAAAVEDGTLTRWQAFMRTQAGARSLAPREGDDPDAVLSRAEAAVAQGDLDTAIAELDALPAEGREALADWLALVETRRAALAAAADLATQLEQN